MLKTRFNPLLDAEGAGSGVATDTQSAGTQEANAALSDAQSGQKGADERKTGENVKSEAQKMADWMLAKRLEGISKDELETIKANKEDIFSYLESRKTEADKITEAQRKATEAEKNAANREARANAMMQVMKAGIKAEHIEDAVILAMAKVSDDITIEEATRQVAANNPSWKTDVRLPGEGGNPANSEGKKKEPPILI